MVYSAFNGNVPAQSVGAIVLDEADLYPEMLIYVVNDGPQVTVTTLGALSSFISVGGAEVSLTSTGNSQSTALSLPGGTSVFTNVPIGTGAVIPFPIEVSGEVQLGTIWEVWNEGVNNLLLYPFKGAKIQGYGENIPVIITVGSYRKFIVNSQSQIFVAAPEIFYAENYGVVADAVISNEGVVTGTSDDAALKNAIEAASAVGGTLMLPLGNILLTGVNSINSVVTNCRIVGQASEAGYGPNNPGGTSFFITGTTASGAKAPFILEFAWSFENINFYWPNQNGASLVPYPPLFTDSGNIQTTFGRFTNVNVINAYDGITQTVGLNWQSIRWDGGTWYACNRLFTLSSTGDSFIFVGQKYERTPWEVISPGSTSTFAAAWAANVLLYVNGNNESLGFTGVMIGFTTFAWNTGIYITDGGWAVGGVNGSIFDGAWDGIATSIIDASTATSASWDIANQFRGSSVTGGVVTFKLGGLAAFSLGPFDCVGGSSGFVEFTNLTELYMDNIKLRGMADAASTLISGTGIGSNTEIIIRNSRFLGFPVPTSSTHGIVLDSPIGKLILQNDEFISFNEVINIHANSETILTGLVVAGTFGSNAFIIPTSAVVTYGGNAVDKPPQPVISNAGSSPSVGSGSGPLNGFFTVGSGTVTACSIAPPFLLANASLASFFLLSGAQISTTFTTGPLVWTISTTAYGSTNLAGQQIYYTFAGAG